jgi:PAS domain S-box-containing protein
MTDTRADPPFASLVAAAAIGLFGALVSILLARDGHLSTLWLPNAFLLSLAALHPEWRARRIVIVGCLATGVANLTLSESPPVAFGLVFANAASVAANLGMLRWLFPEGLTFARPSYILRIALAALVGGVASALVGTPLVGYYHGGNIVRLFVEWLIADALSTLLFVPLILQIADYRASPIEERPRFWTIVWITLGVLIAATAVFAQHLGPSLYLLPPVVLAATLTLGPLGAAIGVAASAAAAIPLTYAGLGPVARIYSDWSARTLFLELYCVVLLFSAAPVAGTLAHIRRISRDLAASRERYSSLVGNLGEVIFRTDMQGRWSFLNPAWERLTGHAIDDSIGRSFLKLVQPDDRAAALARFAPLLEGTVEQCQQELHCVRADGSALWCEFAVEAEYDGAGQRIGFSGTIRDISARRAGELALADSERRFRTIAEYATDIIVTSDQRSVCTYISPSVRDILGYDPAQIIGTPMIDLVHPDELAERTQARQALLSEPGVDAAGRFRMRRSDGGWLWMEVKSRLIDDDPDHPRILSVIRDVEKSKLLEEALVDARDAAEANAKAKSDFVAMISHEIRTPMTGILGMIDLLRETESPAERDRFVQILEGSSRTLMRVLDDVLDVAKLEAGAVQVEAAPFDLRLLATAVVDLFRSSAASRGVALEIAFDGPSPAAVLGDATRLQQVLVNLVGNAVKFTFEGSIVVRVSQQAADRWCFKVTDQGIGIAPDALKTIFDPFAQADASTTRRFGGTGLGLTISRRLVEAQGGALSVESTLGRGSCFSFDLPLPAAPEAALAASTPTPLAATAPDRRLSLLVAEDNAVNRLLIVTLLRRMGHRALTVDNGHAAVAAARQGGYDAILMDVQMPVMDGVEAARAIRALPAPQGSVPIIAITADPFAEDSARVASVGFAAIIGKPIERAALIEALALVVPGHAPRPDLDHVALAEMESHVGRAGVEQLLDLFISDGSVRLTALRAALAARDLTTIRTQAHAIAGGASAAGARRLEAAARRAMRARSTLADGAALGEALEAALGEVGAVLSRAPAPARA